MPRSLPLKRSPGARFPASLLPTAAAARLPAFPSSCYRAALEPNDRIAVSKLFWNRAEIPAAVRIGIGLYFAALGCELVSFAGEALLHPELLPNFNPEHIPYPAFAFVLAAIIVLTLAIWLGVPGWFLYRAAQRRNSGRIAVLILTAIVTWARLPELGPNLQQSLLWGVLGYLYSSVEIVAAALFFTRDSNAWFSAARA